MTIKQLAVLWNNQWYHDHWYRNKHKIAFNSEQHRAINQIDISFEYFENILLNKSLEEYKQDEKRKERYIKDGWISESLTKKEELIDAFNKMNLKDL